jgi:hypothetical protein
MRVNGIAVFGVVALTASLATAESPRGSASATLAGKKVTIDYGRPALKGRTLAQLLTQLPEDRIWRAGDDQVTTLTTETPLLIAGKKVPAGKYSVYVHLPEDGSRNLVLNSDLGIPLIKLWDKAPPERANEPYPHLEGYQKNIAGKELLRAPMRKDAVKEPVETFTVALTPVKDGATLNLAWGEESWSIELATAR